MSNPRLMNEWQLKKELSDIELVIKVLSNEIEVMGAKGAGHSGHGVYWTIIKKRWIYRRKAEWIERCLDEKDLPMVDWLVSALVGVEVINFQ